MPSVILDAGHGGCDNGASYQGRKEKDDNLALTLAVGNILERNGYDVIYTRTEDVYNSPGQKAQIANASGGDYFISFHRNSSPEPDTYEGVETLVYDDSGKKAELARAINRKLAEKGFRDLGVRERKNLIVLRKTGMPAVLVEAGFLNTDTDNERFDLKFQEIAEAAAEGIMETIGTEEERKEAVYRVQTGLYSDYSRAEYALMQAVRQGYDGEIFPWREYQAVRIGEEENLEDAQKLEKELRRLGYDTLIIRENDG